MRPLEVRVADVEGLDVGELIRVIQAHYRKDGKPVRIVVGEGREAGYLLIEERHAS